MSEKKKFFVSEVIDSLGVNKFTWITFVFLGLAMIFDGYDFMIVNTTNTFVARTFWPDNPTPGALMGSLTTWSLIGMVVGGALGGILSDKFGRKKTLTLAVLFYGVFTLPQAFASSYAMFAAFRFIAGFGVGSCIPVVTTTFSETMPSKNRGVFVTFGMAFMVAGWVLAGIVGGALQGNPSQLLPGLTEAVTYTTAIVDGVPQTAEMFANWRVCYLIGAIPILYGIFLGFFMKETPAWYASKGRLDDAARRLKEIQISARGTADEIDGSMILTPPKPARSTPDTLFSKKYIIATCAIWATYFIGQCCVYGMNSWLPTWFRGIGWDASLAVKLQTWNNVAAIASNISVGFISDRVGRKRNLAFSWLFAIVAIVLCSLFVIAPATGVGPDSIADGAGFARNVALMLLFGFALNYAITAVQPLMPESYPTEIRNMGVSWCQAFARFGGAASPIILGALSTSPTFARDGVTNWSSLVLVLIIPLALGFICTMLFVQRETKGKSMDAIQTEIETAA
ncbi:MAG: MFS transporter [Gracilibacteraceae bacterium]|nr:MFS transporter [Gracilibacteraceae bacterium]